MLALCSSIAFFRVPSSKGERLSSHSMSLFFRAFRGQCPGSGTAPG